MLTEYFIQILDHFTEWRIGADTFHKTKLAGRPKKEVDESDPLKGYPVVLAYKTIPQPCEWCDSVCTKQKTYTRPIRSNIWKAKCQDCGETRNFHTSEINKTK